MNIIEDLDYKLNINLSNLISQCEQKSKETKVKRIYCMTENCYNNYKQAGYIINKNNNEYYRYFNNEDWLVYIL